MDNSPPTKPPRGIKPSKETSGLLISVIRALSASETNEQREVEKAKLERDFRQSDQRLEKLVSQHEVDLLEVMRIFSEMSERVTSAREKIHSVKENLNACKQLLSCRREDILKLWVERVEHAHMLQLLNDVDDIREVPLRITNYLQKKHYLHATHLLVSAFSKGEGVLENVEALREVRGELDIKKQKIVSKLLEELNRHLYREVQKESGLKRQASYRDFQRGLEARSSKGIVTKRNMLDIPGMNSGYISGQISRKTSCVGLELQVPFQWDINNIAEDENNLSPEDNSEYFLAILIECLALLNNIPEAIEGIKSQMQNELLKVIDIATLTIHETLGKRSNVNNKIQDASLNDDSISNPLLDLLNIIFDRFRQIITVHLSAINTFKLIVKKHNLEVPLYDIIDVWSCMQAVIQILLTEYLDIQNLVDKPYESAVTLNEQTNDINIYFAKKRPQRQRTGLLFKFESTSHSRSLNTYLKDHRYSSLSLSDSKYSKSKQLVYKADPKNITLIFRPISKFITDIESIMELPTGNSSTLNSFLADYVKEVYLGRHHVLVATTIDAATKAADAWRTTTSPEEERELGLSRPLLKSTIKVQQCVSELRDLMIALPLQGEHFCTLTLNVLHNYRETCHNAYRGIVQPDRHDRLICSAAWLKDEDISRFIKSLPNWESMKNSVQQQQEREALSGGRLRRQETEDEESPEIIRDRNVREAEILAGNLGEGGISSNEILSNIEHLKSLALMQESLEWFFLYIRSLITELWDSTQESYFEYCKLPLMPDSLIESMEQVALEYEELANTCILVLHLEVRVQCFYYLYPRGDTNHLSSEDLEGSNPRVEDLSRALHNMDEALESTLNPKKTKYIFEGLGHLISKILITSAQYIDKISDVGIQRMCRNVFTLQQTLANITMTREIAMDHARQYFELFYKTPDEVLNGIIKYGAVYTELEYINAIQLIARSRKQYASVNMYLKNLTDILADVGIVV